MSIQFRDQPMQAQIERKVGREHPALFKRLALTAIAASFAFAAPVFADDAHHPTQASETMPAEPAASTVQTMQDNVQKMQAQLERVAAAKTDEERRQAMAEHMRRMKDNMTMAGGMMGGGSPDAMATHMERMEKRMDMMQMMIEQMSKAQAMSAPTK